MISICYTGKEHEVLTRLYQNPPGWIRKILNKFIWTKNENEKSVFLTFDDGPDPEVTPLVLNILAVNNVKATFFCLGKNVEKYPGLFKKIRQEGHAVGNHSHDHMDGWKTGKKKYLDNVDKAGKLISGDLFRPPYGRIKVKQAKALRKKYRIVMWDYMCRDYEGKSQRENYLKEIKKYCSEGSIVVFHDTKCAKENLLSELQNIIDYFSGLGFKFMFLK